MIRVQSGQGGRDTAGVIAGLVPAISIGSARRPIIEMAGISLNKSGHDGFARHKGFSASFRP